MNFYAPITDPQQILDLISQTQLGAELVQKLVPHLKTGRIRIRHYPAEIVQKLRALIGEDQPIGACFDTDGEVGTIHLDPQGVMGTLAPFLVHEIVHALDSTLWSAARRHLSPTAKQQILLKAEKNAFETQHQFVDSLKVVYPSYQVFLSESYLRSRILHERLTEESIADLYRVGDASEDVLDG